MRKCLVRSHFPELSARRKRLSGWAFRSTLSDGPVGRGNSQRSRSAGNTDSTPRSSCAFCEREADPGQTTKSRRRMSPGRGKVRRTLVLSTAALALSSCGSHAKEALPPATSSTTASVVSTVPSSSSTTGAPTGPVTPNYGEAATPPVGRVTTTTSARPVAADQIESSARAFLALYWRPETRTYGQLADALVDVATPEVLAPWRDPAYVNAPAGGGAPVDLKDVTITSSAPDVVVLAGKGVNATTGAVVWRTLEERPGADGIWRVSSLR